MKSTGCVLDASALLTVLNREPGADVVVPLLGHARMSAVNWSEVVQKAAGRGIATGDLRRNIESIGVTIIPFDAHDAEEAASLWPRTAPAGLSLADRACLALAQREGLPAVTTDRVWAGLALPIQVQVIR